MKTIVIAEPSISAASTGHARVLSGPLATTHKPEADQSST
jgi:hypothetical protein